MVQKVQLKRHTMQLLGLIKIFKRHSDCVFIQWHSMLCR